MERRIAQTSAGSPTACLYPGRIRQRVYLDDIGERVKEAVPGGTSSPPELLRLYALLVLTTGVNTTLENIHDAWSVWRAQTKPEHVDLVWFKELSLVDQARDAKYLYAIRSVAERTRSNG